jgi:acetyltransferase-like isoleucine patch superfamily enzyme
MLLALGLLIPYLVPLLLFRIICAIYPMKIGPSFFGEDVFSPWVSSYRIQQIYLMFPVLERALFFIPGLYCFWLRLWGSKIGKNVNFIPGVEVVDRGHLNIGNNVFVGNKCYFSPHVVQVRKGRFFLYYKGVTVGDNCFLGAFSTFGPGTVIADGSSIPSGSYYTVNKSEPGCLMPDY